MDYDGNGPRAFTRNGSLNLFPNWAPDNSKLAFVKGSGSLVTGADNSSTSFAGFFGLDPDIWDTVWNRYWPEIEDTVSKGRLAAIANHAHWKLEEQHAGMYDNDVLFTQPAPGVPLLLTGGVGINDPFASP